MDAIDAIWATVINMRFLRYKIQRKIWRFLGRETMDIDISYYRKLGATIGVGVRAFSPIVSAEPYLLSIGDFTTLSAGIHFLTHDNSIAKCITNCTDLFGRISIGRSCFIGFNTIILPGVTITDKVIIAAGSVVTKSVFEPETVWGGNPAHKICTWDYFIEKNKSKALNTKSMTALEKRKYLEANVHNLLVK